jgi:hypothetical protein
MSIVFCVTVACDRPQCTTTMGVPAAQGHTARRAAEYARSQGWTANHYGAPRGYVVRCPEHRNVVGGKVRAVRPARRSEARRAPAARLPRRWPDTTLEHRLELEHLEELSQG